MKSRVNRTCGRDFSPSTRKKGEQLFSRGAAQISHRAATKMIVLVRDKLTFRVVLDRSADVIDTHCTCHAYKVGNFCEHIWASLLVTEAQKGAFFPQSMNEFHVAHEMDLVIDEDDEPLDDYDIDSYDELYDNREYEDIRYSNRPSLLSGLSGAKDLLLAELDKLQETNSPIIPRPRQRGTLSPITPAAAMNSLTDLAQSRHAAHQPQESVIHSLVYILDLDKDSIKRKVFLTPAVRSSSSLKNLQKLRVGHLGDLQAILPDADFGLLYSIIQAGEISSHGYERHFSVELPLACTVMFLPILCSQMKLALPDSAGKLRFLAWAEAPAWDFSLQISRCKKPSELKLIGLIEASSRQVESVTSHFELDKIQWILPNGLALAQEKYLFFIHDFKRLQNIIKSAAELGPIVITDDLLGPFFERVYDLPGFSYDKVAADIRWPLVDDIAPTPVLQVALADIERKADEDGVVYLVVSQNFSYDEVLLAADLPDSDLPVADRGGSVLAHLSKGLLIKRDFKAEEKILARFRKSSAYTLCKKGKSTSLRIESEKFRELSQELSEQGWQIYADNTRVRLGSFHSVRVSSGIDWFDIHGEVPFEQGTPLAFSDVIARVQRDSQLIRLDDGTLGLLPEAWFRRIAWMKNIADGAADGALRFGKAKLTLLDHLIEDMPEIAVDEHLASLRQRLRNTKNLKAINPSGQFKGRLRPYQKMGLSWLSFLKECHFGGCLADDMGLGKTVQVLGILDLHYAERQRLPKEPGKPSLIVVPRSLVHNWLDEASKFSPHLKLVDCSKPDRHTYFDEACDGLIMVTTYAILRIDIDYFASQEFDYVILDEAQNIKNYDAQSAKSARLLQAKHRLALTGTPVENHVGDLLSIFDFLNPGFIGKSSVLRDLKKAPTKAKLEDLQLVGKALTPFILRRTKEKVLPDLPSKSEQVKYCTLNVQERRLYNTLQASIRASLTQKIAQKGIQRNQIQILEGLLRLRQAACHTGLIQPARAKELSSKFKVLLEALAEITAEGHKALIFSQFTKMLQLLKVSLDAMGLSYEYLDGRTKNRKRCVERFQNDPGCPLFLISLKAGGVGLNLTAADYCFIIDPWWNPAAEAQAVDRAHRIGQQKNVFVYRLIAENTVEDKIIQLQQQKRKTAEQLIQADGSFGKNFSAEDFNTLFS